MSEVRVKQEATLARQTPRRRTEAGFAVVQTLVVLAIAGIVAAIAIPVCAARAKESVLRQNTATLELEVKSYLAAGLDDSDDEVSASEIIAHALCGPGSGVSAWYVNPLCGSRAVVFQTALPAGTGGVPPAVWITDVEVFYVDAAGHRSPTATTIAI
jgi:F0F1-type ATP synthase membrane subunit c/vacuolar-type H+-ATPase subunit K